jgi:hypothetical protein
VLALSLTACGAKDKLQSAAKDTLSNESPGSTASAAPDPTSDGGSTASAAPDPASDGGNTASAAPDPASDGSGTADTNLPLHEQLVSEADINLGYARQAANMGVLIQGEYYYGLALAEVSSLRLCADNILWLKGEGETVDEIVGAAPYSDWNDIVAAGLGSPMPFYFEGLLFKVQAKDAEAEACFKQAKANPTYTERDFYYLKNMSVEDLYALHNTLVEKELKILDEYTPRAALYIERTGAEFAPVYHAALAGEKLEAGDNVVAYGCFLNAVLCNPQAADYYVAAILLGLQNGQNGTAMALLNEGLYAFPKNGEINYAAATVAAAKGDNEGAKAFLQTAKADMELPAEFAAQCDALLAQIGGPV